MKRRKVRILLLGPLPPPLGGVRVMFAQLAEDLALENTIATTVIQVGKYWGRPWPARAVDTFAAVARLIIQAPRHDVISLHGSNKGISVLAPFVFLVSKTFGKPCMLRSIGGSFMDYYQQLPRLWRWILRRTALAMDMVLVETKQQVEYFRSLGGECVKWYPNSRPLSPDAQESTPHRPVHAASRFVFVGHVKPTKGVLDIVEAARQLSDTTRISVDIYGPIMGDVTAGQLTTQNTAYCGVMRTDDVISKLRTYDVLLLPTYHDGEGYPGVILEAFSAGIPVITTNWKAISELVDDSCGILIDPRDPVALANAMQELATSLDEFTRLRQGARAKAVDFDTAKWRQTFIEYNVALTCDRVNCH